MNNNHTDGSGYNNDSHAIDFFEKLRESYSFDDLFNEGMELAEEAAEYLNGVGPQQSKNLNKSASLAYINESLHLTNRIMQTSAWLLAQRAGKNGEIDPERIILEKLRITVPPDYRVCTRQEWNGLPAQFKEIIYRSIHIQQRILHLERDHDNDDNYDDYGQNGKLIDFLSAKKKLSEG